MKKRGRMAPDSGNFDQAVSRALRENLDKLQRTSEELHQAVADLVAACASNRPTNALPPMLRAQTAAASLAAALDVLSRFITAAQSAQRTPAEVETLHMVTLPPPEPSPRPSPPPPSLPVPMGGRRPSPAPGMPVGVPEPPVGPSMEIAEESPEEMITGELVAEELPSAARMHAAFNLSTLPPEEQELHRRANRVAKVSMQDIQMLRPEQVRQGRQHKDLCARLRDEIEKAHKEYDRRFQPILDHPVDYFYSWMVEILAGGDPEALGEYPYPSPVLRR